MTRIFLTFSNVFRNCGMSLQSFVRSFGTVCVQFFCRRLTETVALRTYVLLHNVLSPLVRQQKDRDGGVGLMGERVCFEAIRGRMTGKHAAFTLSRSLLALFRSFLEEICPVRGQLLRPCASLLASPNPHRASLRFTKAFPYDRTTSFILGVASKLKGEVITQTGVS